jgi:hypothetical protein
LLKSFWIFSRLYAAADPRQNCADTPHQLLDSSYELELKSRPLLSKALVRLSGECGLHPTCFALSGLEKVGQQVAGGSFGDICKGLVGGETVAVKSMRQYMDDDLAVTLKVTLIRVDTQIVVETSSEIRS